MAESDNLDAHEHDDDETRLRESPIESGDELTVFDSGSRHAPAEESVEEAASPKLPMLGDYILLSKIGEGGMGRVFKARDSKMDRIVALKLLSSKLMKNEEAVRRFLQEVKAAAQLFHPNIVTALHTGEHQGMHYLVMEYVDGSALSQTVKQHGPVTLETAISYTLQAAQGLQYAHSRGVVHRDIKPSNLMLDADGCVKILDMGTARFGGEEKKEENLTQTGVIMGTVNYMSPEQARDAHSVDYRTDIYSLGCTFYYLLTGKPLYEGDMIKTLLAHAREPIPSLQEYDHHIPVWVDETLKRMLAKNPADRFQSIAEVIESFEAGVRSQQDDDDDESREMQNMLSASTLLASISSSPEAAVGAAVASTTSALTMRPCGPEPFSDFRSSPLSAAIRRASGVAKMRSPEAATGAAGAGEASGAGASAGFSAAETGAGAAAGAAPISSALSPSSSSTAIRSLTFTPSVPSATTILPMVPSSTASNSIVALSVSISARMSPEATSSPSLTSHFASVPSSIVGESAGIRIFIGIFSPP